MENKRIAASHSKQQPKGVKFLDAKVVIVVSSLVITVGVWNLLSGDLARADLGNPASISAPPPGQEAVPTLVPLVEVSGASAVGGPEENFPLRSVAAPQEQAIIQKGKVVVDIQAPPAQPSSSNNSGSNGSSNPATTPVTTTRTS